MKQKVRTEVLEVPKVPAEQALAGALQSSMLKLDVKAIKMTQRAEVSLAVFS